MATYPKPKVLGMSPQDSVVIKPLKLQAPHGATKTLKVRIPKRKHKQAAPVPFAQRPITPGSAVTYGDALRQANNAALVQYGPNLSALQRKQSSTQQLGVDQAGWYDAYIQALRGYQTDTQNRATATNTAVKGLSDSLRGLDQTNLTEQQQALQTDAATRGATVDPRLAQDSSNASIVRQGLQASLGALIAQQGLSAGNQASNMANVVGPGQKLQAQAQNAKNVLSVGEEIAREQAVEGAFRQSIIDSIRSSEGKNALAAAIATGKDLSSQSRITETTRHNKAQEKIAADNPSKAKTKAELAYFRKHGYWPPTGPPKQPKAPAQKTPRTGLGSLTQNEENKITAAIDNAASFARHLRRGGTSEYRIRGLLLTGAAAKDGTTTTKQYAGAPETTTQPGTPKIPAFDQFIVNAAMDLVYLGGLSQPNVNALHKRGVHVSGRYKTLTPKQVKKQGKQLAEIFKLPPPK